MSTADEAHKSVGRMSRTLRALNVVTAVFSLASGLAVLGSSLVDPAYRAHYRDPLWLAAAYVAFYAAVVWAFARARPSAVHLAVAKAVGAYAFLGVCAFLPWMAVGSEPPSKGLGAFTFLSGFTALTREWVARTPGRYVYQLVDWGPDAAVVFLAFVFLGRGAWNTVNAFTLTRDVWLPLRDRSPLLGRLVTAVPVALLTLFVWAFFATARLQATTFSAEAHEVAQAIAAGLDCPTLNAKAGETTTDVRERGDRRFDVMIRWGCPSTLVLVRTPEDKVGTAAVSRPDCCGT